MNKYAMAAIGGVLVLGLAGSLAIGSSEEAQPARAATATPVVAQAVDEVAFSDEYHERYRLTPQSHVSRRGRTVEFEDVHGALTEE